jgi:outer membrane protein OmpA-like peptidoglycan-associated protein
MLAAILALIMATYPDAWSPETVAAADAAVARLGAKRALDVEASIVKIVGLEARAVIASVQQVRQAMNALAAQETNLEIRINFPAEVLFDFDKSDIRSDAASALANLATIIRANPNSTTRLEGHTDSKGDDRYNQTLSERRAESVKQWLATREKLDAAKLVTKGWGETKPVASNEDDAGRQRNRRLEAVIEKVR